MTEKLEIGDYAIYKTSGEKCRVVAITAVYAVVVFQANPEKPYSRYLSRLTKFEMNKK